ncbi:hypothetical protein B0T26DRAFT_599132, partial [Lasiosphaeria miniovina]
LVSCQQSLAFREMDDRIRDINRATNGTCKWLLEHSEYRSWNDRDRSLLLIMGNPGSGKSTLLRHAVENATTKRQPNDLILSFFFHGRGTDLQKTRLGFFRSVLHQLLCSVPHALPSLVSVYQERCQRRGAFGEKWHWSLDELQDFFKSSLPKVLESHSIRLFIDALDECGEEDAVELAGEFKTLIKQLPHTASLLHICFTCRHYPILELDLDHNGEDIVAYVQSRESEISLPVPILEAITGLGRATGVFMWVRLVMERILRSRRQGLGWLAIAKGIGHIPEKLHDFYTELLQDLAGVEKARSQKMFQWICFAKRRLLLDELQWAMIVDVDSPHRSLRESRRAEDYDSDMEKRVKTLSRGLAEVKVFPEGTVVQFIHQSVQNFIIGNYLSMLTTGNDEAAMVTTGMLGRSHYRLSGTCLRYLAMEEIALSIQNNPEAKEIESRFPFLRYATTSWVTHMARIDTVDEAQDLLQLLAWPSNALIELWSHVYQIIDGNSSDCPPAATSLLHLISKSGVLTLLRVILQVADTITREASKKDGHGRIPLHYAAENGHEA